jgi:glycosyltransferase involved in cell wall biosynthesis
MRVLVWPTYSFAGNVGADSLYLIARNLVRQADGGFWTLVVPDLPSVPVDDLDEMPNVRKWRVPAHALYRVQEAQADASVLWEFAPHEGMNPVDAVVSLSPGRLFQIRDAWGIRMKEADLPVHVSWDLLVRDDGAGEMRAMETELLAQSAGNAVADLIVHESPVARRMTLDVARKHLSMANVKRIVERSVDVPQGIHVKRLMDAVKDVPKREKFTVYYGGRFSTSKRVNDLSEIVDAFYRFGRDVEFVITTGSLDGNKHAKFVERFPQVKLEIGLPQEEAWRVMASCHASICFSTHELFGMAFWEQMAAGLSVVMKAQSWNRDLVPPEYPLMVSSALEAATKLRLVHEQWEAGETISPEYAEFVKSRYDAAENCAEIVRLMSEMVDSRNAATVARWDAGSKAGLLTLLEEALEGVDEVSFPEVIDLMRKTSRVGANVVGARMKWAKSFATREVLLALRRGGWQEVEFDVFRRTA